MDRSTNLYAEMLARTARAIQAAGGQTCESQSARRRRAH